MSIKVTFQLVVNCHPDSFHLFHMNYDEMDTIFPSMKLIGIPGVPNVVGPDAEFDNAITQLAFDGKSRRTLAQLHGYRNAAATLDEIKKELPEWTYIREIPNSMVRDDNAFRKNV